MLEKCKHPQRKQLRRRCTSEGTVRCRNMAQMCGACWRVFDNTGAETLCAECVDEAYGDEWMFTPQGTPYLPEDL